MEERAIRILLVDDEERFRRNIAKMLERFGMEVEEAEDGETAVVMSGRGDYDVILLDMKMPGMWGKEALRQMRDNGVDSEVIVLTGHASIPEALDMMTLGAFDYLLKPVSVHELFRKVKLAGEKRSARGGWSIMAYEMPPDMPQA